MFRLSFYPVFESWVIAGLLWLVLLGILLFFPPAPDRFSKGQRRFILLIRIAALCIFGFIIVRPSAVFTISQKLPASLLLVYDQSESMGIEDEKGGISRFERMKSALTDSSHRLQQLQTEYDLQVFGFDRSITSSTLTNGQLDLPQQPTGEQTAIGEVLTQCLKQVSGKRATGLLLLSDGSQRCLAPSDLPIQDAALRLRDAGLPVYAMKLGHSEGGVSLRDVAVCDLLCNERVFVKNELVVSGQIRVSGFAGKPIPVRFLFEDAQGKMQEVGRIELTAPNNSETFFPYRFVHRPDVAGEKKLQVVIDPQERELINTNNQLSSFVHVVDGGLKILYLEGTRRFEQKFLRLSLDSSADIHVDYWRPQPDTSVRLEEQTQEERIARATTNRESLVKSFQKGAYAAYILGDLDSSAFKKEELEALHRSVSEGAGLILLAGQRSLSRGGFAETPLADISPVKLNRSDRIPLNMDLETFDKSLSVAERLRINGPFTLVPATEPAHPVARFSIDSKKNREIWNSLPGIPYLYKTGSIKPGAQTLIQSGGNDDSRHVPFLISQLYGGGRVVLISGDSTWRWWMNGFEAEHKKFWRQAVLWVAQLDEIPRGTLAIEMDRSRYLQGEPVDFRLIYRPENDKETIQTKAHAELVFPDGHHEPISLLDDGNVRSGHIQTTNQDGDYRIEAAIADTSSGRELKRAQSRFLVYSRNLELDNPGANPASLENIAQMTGGKAFSPEELPDVLDDILRHRDELTDVRDLKRTLYDTWPVFLLLVGLLSCEWFLRKRWGLV